MNLEKLEKEYDQKNMLEIIRSFPRQLRKAIEVSYAWKLPPHFKKKYSGIIVQGMGGSAIGGLVARRLLLEKLKLPLVVNRDYSLPAFANNKWLAVIVSYSGNTEETLSVFSEAKKKKMSIVCISSNGTLSKKCKNCIRIPRGFPPRTQLAMTMVPVLAVLEKLALAREKSALKESAEFLQKNIQETEKLGKKLAVFLKGKIPVVYAPAKFAPAAERFHTQLAENSKAFSHWNMLPELNHNEIVGWKPSEKNLGFVLFRDNKETKKEKKRFEFTKKLAGKKSACIDFRARGKTLHEKMLYLISIGDFASYYLALLNKENPWPVKNIEKLKKELK